MEGFKSVLILSVVATLLLFPLCSTVSEGGGVGVTDTEPWISDVEVNNNGNGYDISFLIVHLNGVNSIHRITVELDDWSGGRSFSIEFGQNETRHYGDVPSDIEITRADTRDVDEDKNVFMGVSMSLNDGGYSSGTIRVSDLYDDAVEKEVSFPSLFSGHQVSIFTIPIIGGLVVYSVKDGYKKDKKNEDIEEKEEVHES